METSARSMNVVALPLLFVVFVSVEVVETVAVLVMLEPAPPVTVYVATMVFVEPAPTVPSEQGKAVVQSPLFETKVRFAGVGSLTMTLSAADGPALFTRMVYEMFCPTPALAGPLLVMPRSPIASAVIRKDRKSTRLNSSHGYI